MEYMVLATVPLSVRQALLPVEKYTCVKVLRQNLRLF